MPKKEVRIVDDLSHIYTGLSTEKKDNVLKVARKLLHIQEGSEVMLENGGSTHHHPLLNEEKSVLIQQ
jgi:hypothetical protein